MMMLRHRMSLAVLRSWGEISCMRSFTATTGGTADSQDDSERASSGNSIDFGFREVPVQEKQTLVGQVFSSVAPSYDIMNDLMSGGLHRLWKDRLVESLAPFPGQRHLDVAGGTGDVAFRVYRAMRQAEKLRDDAVAMSSAASSSQTNTRGGGGYGAVERMDVGSVVICDINAAMLAEGERKAAAQGIGPSEMRWVEGNAEKLPFTDASFDSYTIAFGVRNVTDRLAALGEAHRVLRPGGRFLCLEFSQVVLPIPGIREAYDWYSFNVIPEIGRVVAGNAESYKYLVESIRMFPPQEAFADMIRQAGFCSVDYENLTGGVVAIHSGLKTG